MGVGGFDGLNGGGGKGLMGDEKRVSWARGFDGVDL